MSEYAERDIEGQDDVYVKHISAMTGEGLHSKSAIAAELAHRDIEITRLRDELERCKELLKSLSNSAAVVSQSINTGDYIPEFRYKNFEKDIKAARNSIKEQLKESSDGIL